MVDVMQELLDGNIGIRENGDPNIFAFLKLVEEMGFVWLGGANPTSMSFISDGLCMKIGLFNGYRDLRLGRVSADPYNPECPLVVITASEFFERMDKKDVDFSDFDDVFGE